MAFLEIVRDNATFRWSPAARSDTVFTLRKMTAEERRQLKKKYTSFRNWRGTREEVLDGEALTADALDAVIVDWTGVYLTEDTDGGPTRTPLDCTRENKLQMPEWVKSQVIQMCLGGDVSEVFGDAPADPPSPSPSISAGSKRGAGKTAAV